MRTAMAYLNGERGLRAAVGLLAVMMLPLAVVMQFNPMGPQGTGPRIAHLTAAVLGFLLGVRWWVGRMPSYREAIWFLVLADVFVGVAVGVVSDPTARICGTLHLAMVGLFAAFLLGWRFLLLHCAYSLALIAGFTAYAIAAEGRTFFELYVYTTPAVTTVVGLPVVVQVLVEIGRFGVARLTDEWNIDTLTGAYSRRGMKQALKRLASRASADGLVLVGALDLDGFKRFNDTHGHVAGDQLLRDVVRALNTVPQVTVGRYGGDEFGIVGFRHGAEEVARTVEQLRALLRPRGSDDDTLIPASLGIVVAPVRHWNGLDELVSDADAMLYEAKRSQQHTVVVRDSPVDR